MDISLNGENLQIEMEDETFVLEVLIGLKDWLCAEGYLLSSFTLDGNIYHIEMLFQEQWTTDALPHKIEEVNTLEVFTRQQEKNPKGNDFDDVIKDTFASLEILLEFFDLAYTSIVNKNWVLQNDLFSDQMNLITLLSRILKRSHQFSNLLVLSEEQINFGSFLLETLDVYLKDPQALKEVILTHQDSCKEDTSISCSSKDNDIHTIGIVEDLLSQIHMHLQLIQSKYLKVFVNQNFSSNNSMISIQEQLKLKLATLDVALGLLQNGQAKEVFQCIADLTLLLEELLIRSRVGKEDLPVKDAFIHLKLHLIELSQAIEDCNTVGIVDLLEYEITPLIYQIANTI